MYTEANKYYEVFVTNSDLPALTLDTECASLYQYTNQYTKDVLTCKRVLNGNQVVIRTENNSLQLFEINVYQCSQGTYGMQCERECRNCEDNRCDGYTGACESGCNIGWQGTTCETKCNKNCVDNKCDQDTGFCTVGCKLDWYGDKCDRQCPSLCESPCDRYLGCTNCQIGYNGPNCDQCYANMYGKNCSLTCQNCDDCNNVNGCGECQNGYYGDFCNIECPKRCRNYICSRQSGDCVYGCKDGYAGTKCETSCKDNCTTCSTYDLCTSCFNGRFGTNCEYRCPQTCGGSKTCDKNSGVCSGCNPGTFGPNCTQRCSNKCSTGISSVCYRNGTCISGCVDGWFGSQCDKQCSIENCEKCNLLSSGDFSCETCNIGYYSKNEQGIRKCVKCPSRCVSCESDLTCTQCIPKFTGNQCENECNVNCVDGSCEFDGTCTYGCNNSNYGAGCSEDCSLNCVQCSNKYSCEKCVPGFYSIGSICRGKCNEQCFNCTSLYVCEVCKPGFYGGWCNRNCGPECLTCDSGDFCTSCRDGWFGRSCKCSKNCENKNCNDRGICQSGCNGSYYGKRCDVSCPSKNCQRCEQMSGNCTQCSNGLYGINCTDQCSGSCLGSACDMTGACLHGCEEGFGGKECTKIRLIPVYGRFHPNGSQEKINFVAPDTRVKTDYEP